jgi:hypothetical protein
MIYKKLVSYMYLIVFLMMLMISAILMLSGYIILINMMLNFTNLWKLLILNLSFKIYLIPNY